MTNVRSFIIISFLLPLFSISNQAHACVGASNLMPGVSIEGRKRDLVGFYYAGRRVYLDAIRDGDDLSCNARTVTVPGIQFQTPPTSIPGTEIQTYFTPSFQQFTVQGDIVVTGSIIAVRHGRKRDLLRAYGIIRNGEKRPIGLVRLVFTPRDGSNAVLHSAGSGDIMFTYGRKRDLNTRFCFNGKVWTRSPGNSRGQSRPSNCSENASNLVADTIKW